MLHEYQPHRFTQWFIHRHGVDHYDWLSVKFAKTAKFTNQDLRLLILEFTEKLHFLFPDYKINLHRLVDRYSLEEWLDFIMGWFDADGFAS